MDEYDVIIIGAGIAGCGLAYNLARIAPKKSVLIIERDQIGASAGYGYRTITKAVQKEYHLPYEKKFKGLKIGSHTNVLATIPREDYFADYKKVCTHLVQNSAARVVYDSVVNVEGNRVYTNDRVYQCTYVVDCSGPSSFLKRKAGKATPMRYWIGKTRVLEGVKQGIDPNYYYYLFGEEGSFEDLYVCGKDIIHGFWQFSKTVDFEKIVIPKDSFIKRHTKGVKVQQTYRSVIASAPVFPIVDKNIAFLGDSFGNAYTASAVGTTPILESSRLLAEAIVVGDLTRYEKAWKKRYFIPYLKFLASRLDRYHESRLMRFLKRRYPKNIGALAYFDKHPQEFIKILENDDTINIKEIEKTYPWYRKLFVAFEFLRLRVYFFFTDR